jgi:taurine dioxygenase
MAANLKDGSPGRNRLIEVRPLAGALGAEIPGIDLARGVSDAVFAEIHEAFLEHLVIFLPQAAPLTPEAHGRFAARFGEIDQSPFVYPFKLPTVAGHPEILLNVKEAGDRAVNFGGFWHADVTYRERPHKAGVQYAKAAPQVGGDTMFANQYLAYETLSDGMKAMLGPLKAVHSSRMAYGGEEARFAAVSRTHAPLSEDRRFAASQHAVAEAEISAAEHPVVRTHPETGRKFLYVNRGFTERFAGMTQAESLPLLEFLWEHAVRPEFTCRRRWTPHEVGVWDNRCVLHYALNDYYGQRREMHRIAVHEPARPV